MLHHVSIEVEPGDVEGAIEFWELLGFQRIEAPAELGGYVTWLERAGTQIHLIHAEGATVPPLGHPAVVVEDFEATFAALDAAGLRAGAPPRAVGRGTRLRDDARRSEGRADGRSAQGGSAEPPWAGS